MQIGVSLSILPAKFDPSESTPLYLVVTARILDSPRPDRPITLDTWLNPFHCLRSRCFKNIKCVSGEAEQPPKSIKVWPKFHFPKYGLRGLDIREGGGFVTLEPNKTFEIRHEVPQDEIAAAVLVAGEVYKAEMTDLGLGTRWWMYGTMDEAGDKKFMRWSPRGVEGLRRYQLDNVDTLGEPREDLIWEDSSEWIMGEDPMKLALVIEKGEAEFEIIYNDV